MGTMGVTSEQIAQYDAAFASNQAAQIAANASVKDGVLNASIDYRGVRRIPYTFNVDLKQGSITAQKSSGRCWLFASLNVLRFEFMHRWNVEDFELSQSFPFFWDKLEKANFFLESVMQTLEEPADGRLYSWINGSPLGDGGQWTMFAELIKKYGICPKEAYPDSKNAENSGCYVGYLTSKLREFAVELRTMAKNGASVDDLRSRKAQQLEDVYRILVISLGEPPKSFDFVCRDKDGKVLEDRGITPKQFYDKYIGLNLDDYISLINAPTEDKPYNRMFTVQFLGNVIEGRPVLYLNLPMDVIKKAAVKQLQAGHPVWFGSDCGKFSLRDEGVFDRGSMRIEDLFQIHYDFTKGDRLTYGESAMNHAMVFMGVNIDSEGTPDRWRVENSWGKDPGHGGYYIASDSWFDEFVYQVVIRREFLDKDTLALLDQKPIELAPWDPMGTLA